MKKIICILLLFCTLTFCLTSCAKKCETCSGETHVYCKKCYGLGAETCDMCCYRGGDCYGCDGDGTASDHFYNKCDYCLATYAVYNCPYNVQKTCERCKGTGKCPFCDGTRLKPEGEVCYDCGGSGQVICPDCEGSGRAK